MELWVEGWEKGFTDSAVGTLLRKTRSPSTYNIMFLRGIFLLSRGRFPELAACISSANALSLDRWSWSIERSKDQTNVYTLQKQFDTGGFCHFSPPLEICSLVFAGC